MEFWVDSIEENLNRVTAIEDNGVFDLFVTHEMTIPKTVWRGENLMQAVMVILF